MGSLPFAYLGLPVGGSPCRLKTWKPLLDHLKARLASWRGRFLSMGGRLTLLNAVLTSIPVYFLSVYKMPAGVATAIDRLRRQFLWSGPSQSRSILWVRWDVVCLPKTVGGLGVKQLHAFNLALLAKWWWKATVDKDTLWARFMAAKYGSTWLTDRSLADSRLSAWVRDIRGLDLMAPGKPLWLSGNIKRCVKDGESTLFWTDWWVGAGTLARRYPRLFSASLDSRMLVSEVRGSGSVGQEWVLRWRRPLFVWEQCLLQALLRELAVVPGLGDGHDEWRWLGHPSGLFSAKSAYQTLRGEINFPSSPMLSRLWIHFIPLKVLIFLWKALRDRLPTRYNLAKRGLGSVLDCARCNGPMEDTHHILFGCPFAFKVWILHARWWNLVTVAEESWSHLLHFSGNGCSKSVKLVWRATSAAVLWSLWKSRNELVFTAGLLTEARVFSLGQVNAFNWLKARCKGGSSCLVSWLLNPRSFKCGT
ncbi:hypothetical protein Ancab_039814 [Ancistrocladus abbreviatus]